jgi:hypothetical protein
VHRAAVEDEAAELERWCDASSTAGWRRTRSSSTSSSRVSVQAGGIGASQQVARMIELVDTLPDINVQPRSTSGCSVTRATGCWKVVRASWPSWAREWYAKTAAVGLRAAGESLEISTARSDRRRRVHEQAAAEDACTSAGGQRDPRRRQRGPEVEAEAQRLWREEKPDEYFFLEIFGSAVVEHLVTITGARLCAWAEGRHLAVLPHYSPGIRSGIFPSRADCSS